jgi:DHA3 family macrolide efflux protein-like MFS transporter
MNGLSIENAAGTDARLRTFWTIWSGQALSLVGSQASQFALVWWLTQQSGSPAILSTATLLAMLPSIALGPAIGALVDRWSRRVTMIVADGAVALGSLVLAGLFLTGRASIGVVLLFVLGRAIGGAFHAPAMLAATSLMVPAEHLGRVQGANQMLQGGIGIFTAPLGALLLGLVGMTGVLALDVATALFAILPLLVLAIPEPERSTGQADGETPPSRVFQDVRAGLSYLWNLPGHLALIGFAAVMNLCLVPAFALLPLLVLRELGGNAATQAWLTAAVSAGLVGGGLVLGVWGASRSRVRTALAAIVGLGVSTLVVGATPHGAFPLAVAAMLAVGACAAVTNGCIAAVLQATVAPEYQGRVFTLMTSLATAMTPIGLLVATPIADAAGVRLWYVAAGVACAALGSAAFFVRPILEMENRAS